MKERNDYTGRQISSAPRKQGGYSPPDRNERQTRDGRSAANAASHTAPVPNRHSAPRDRADAARGGNAQSGRTRVDHRSMTPGGQTGGNSNRIPSPSASGTAPRGQTVKRAADTGSTRKKGSSPVSGGSGKRTQKGGGAKKRFSLPNWLLLPDTGTDEDIIRIKGSFDRPMLIIVLALIGFGLIMVFSASYVYALSKTGDSLYYIKRQLLFAVLGIAALILMMNVDYRILYRFSAPAFIATSILLVLTPLYGMAAGAAVRWIDIGGIRFQPSEIMKLVLVLFLSRYFMIYEKAATNTVDKTQASAYGLFIPGAYVLFVCVLIALENHFSCMIIMFSIGMVVIFVAGAKMFWFAIAGAAASVTAIIAIMFSSYARQRVDVWLRPENYSADKEVYQTLQGLYAIGSGGLLGTGLGNSRQKHLFVSQPQNDFIYTIVCEELGFVGALGVIALFLLLIWRGCVIALRAPDTFSQLVVIGIIGKVAIQALLNIGVVTACLPNTGISLPFFSYGGTALAMQIAEMGIVLGISRYSRRT